MIKFVELCVELRRGRLVKDGLHQYRSISQNVNVQGLETVMKHFLEQAERRLKEAHSRATAASSHVDAVDDLEQAPEETLASVWGSTLGDEKERTGRELVTPWLRFVWEGYRIILDICRHNAKLEALYRVIVERAFAFCREYQRKAEFRRLSEILRHHLSIIIKYPTQANGVLLSAPESHQLQLELRFGQLDVATEMELWHEAFRSIEDIHGLFVLARKSAKPSLVITYYERLCRVFQRSSNYLYLAATLCKLLVIGRSQGRDREQMSRDATLAVLALTAAPLLTDHDFTNTMAIEEQENKNSRLAYFLGMQKAPTRASIIKELHLRAIYSQAEPSVQELFTAIENSDAPNKDKIGPLLAKAEANPDFAPFVPAIYKNIVARLLKQVSLTERTITFDSLHQLISLPTVTSSLDFDLDAFILEGFRNGDFHARIDHIEGVLRFQKPCFAPPPVLELNDSRRSKAIKVLQTIEHILHGLKVASEPSGFDPAALMLAARGTLDAEHKSNLARKALIEKNKERLEEILRRREVEENRERQIKLQMERDAEKTRHAQETARREAVRRQQECEEIRREQAERREEEEKRKREAASLRANLEKLIAVTKRLDHLERAYRQEEIPLLKSDYVRQKSDDLAAYKERVVVTKAKAEAQHKAEIQLKSSLQSMADECQLYISQFKARAEQRHAARKEAAFRELEAAKALRREQVLAEIERARIAVERGEEARALQEQRQKLAQLRDEQQQQQQQAQSPVLSPVSSEKQAYKPPSRRAGDSVSSPAAGAMDQEYAPRTFQGRSAGPFESRSEAFSTAFGSRSSTATKPSAFSGAFMRRSGDAQ